MSRREPQEYNARLSEDGQYICGEDPRDYSIDDVGKPTISGVDDLAEHDNTQSISNINELFMKTYYSNQQNINNDLLRQAQDKIYAMQDSLRASMKRF